MSESVSSQKPQQPKVLIIDAEPQASYVSWEFEEALEAMGQSQAKEDSKED